jgi:hypothetical protein
MSEIYFGFRHSGFYRHWVFRHFNDRLPKRNSVLSLCWLGRVGSGYESMVSVCGGDGFFWRWG